jgi:16S rRNA (cytidine1402-2'-O)-methyltransferase
LISILGDRDACLFRELTKIHEESLYGKLSAMIDRVKPLGEFVLVVAGGSSAPKEPLHIEGLSRKDLLKLLAEKTGISKKHLYDALLKD